MKDFLTIVFKDWQEKIARPIFVSVTTALILFLASLSFTPVRAWLFPSKPFADYPLISTAEPHVSKADNKLIVDFFIINRTDKAYTHEELVTFLQLRNAVTGAKSSPDIELKYWRKEGKFAEVVVDQEFNDQKGNLDITFQPGSDKVLIKVVNIKERAVMKVSILIDGLPELKHTTTTRMTKDAVPFLYENYQDACYMRDSN